MVSPLAPDSGLKIPRETFVIYHFQHSQGNSKVDESSRSSSISLQSNECVVKSGVTGWFVIKSIGQFIKSGPIVHPEGEDMNWYLWQKSIMSKQK